MFSKLDTSEQSNRVKAQKTLTVYVSFYLCLVRL